jgi:hypothetical protein
MDLGAAETPGASLRAAAPALAAEGFMEEVVEASMAAGAAAGGVNLDLCSTNSLFACV